MATHNGKEMIGPDASSVSAYDENFAQSAEAIDRRTLSPDSAAIRREGEDLLEQLESAARFHLSLVNDPDADRDLEDAAGARYEKLLEEWTQFQEGERSLAELTDGAADPFEDYQPRTLADYMNRDLETGEDLPGDARELVRETWFRILGFCFDDWNCNVGQGFKHFLAAVRRSNPEYLRRQGLTQRDLAILLGETKAAVSAREIRTVEKRLAAAGMKGIRLAGNTKSDATRRRCSEAQQGNRNRRTGTRKKRA